MAKSIPTDEVDKFFRQLRLVLLGIVVFVFLPLVIYAVYMDRRLDSFEQSLRYKPPAESGESVLEEKSDYLITHPVQGQIVYVPAYSHIYHDDGAPYLLTITLSVRNTSIDQEIVVKSVRYYNTQGKEVKSYLKKTLRLAPLATTEFLVERDDATGGSGANFLVEWVAEASVAEPIIEAVMIDTQGKQGVSFARVGKPVREFVSENGASAKREASSPETEQPESRE